MSNCAFTYRYRVSGLNKVSAEVAGKICQELTESEGGLTPQRLVDVSRDTNHPLHCEFEWNDSIAAESYRIIQAQKLIRNITIVRDEDEKKSDRGFVITPGRDSTYVPLNDALNNDVWRENLLSAAKRDMIAFIAKYRRLQELTAVIEPMTDLVELLK